jgi:hypothetical protein
MSQEWAMPRFYFNLIDGVEQFSDFEGSELPGLAEVAGRALHCARDLMSEDVRNGRLHLNMRLTVTDEHGAAVHQLTFVDAVEIVFPD